MAISTCTHAARCPACSITAMYDVGSDLVHNEDMTKSYVIGIDIGGTKISAAICDFSGEIIFDLKWDTCVQNGAEYVIQRVLEAIRTAQESSGVPANQLRGIGISSPGPLSVSEGKIVFAPMLNWKDVYIRDIIKNAFNTPVFLENDTNSAAYGEKCLGAGKDYENVIYITVSTGVSCGIITNGKIIHGRHDFAGELGHICIVPDGRSCACGNKGCLEAYTAGPGIAAIAREMDIRNSKILTYSDNDISNVDCLAIAKAARDSDTTALELWNSVGENLGLGVSIIAQLLDPDIVILGGGVTEAWDLFYKPMLGAIRKHSYPMISGDLQVVRAGLGQKACLIGAALIAAHQLQGLN